MRLSVFALLSLTLVVTATSCRLKSKRIFLELAETDTTHFLRTPDFSAQQSVELRISNTADSVAVFYITPVSIDLFSDSAIVTGLLNKTMSDQEKCITLWKFICQWTYHAQPLTTASDKINDPAVMLNGFQSSICDDRNAVLSNLANFAGIPARVYELGGHVVSEMYYDNSWHMFDADKHVYFCKENGQIASVEYLGKHPEIIDKKGEELNALFDRIRNKRTRNAIASIHNNQPNSLYTVKKSNYTSCVELKENDELIMRVIPENYFRKFYSVGWMARNGPLYKRHGIYNSRVDFHATRVQEDGACIFKEHFPYPVHRISLNTNRECRIYYSHDGERWYFKGVANGNSNSVSFNPFTDEGTASVFEYHLKLVPIDFDSEDKRYCTIQNEFTFSARILFDNPGHSFRIVPLNEEAKKIDVRLTLAN